jgi:hypothetical protein
VPAVTGASTIASVVGVHTIHNKRHAALAGLYAVTSDKLDDYREKAEELLGPKKTQQFNNELAQKEVDRNPIDNHEVLITGNGNELCYDEWSGRYFMGSFSVIDKAIDQINLQLVESGDATLNDFYDYVGLPPIQAGTDVGWSGKKIEWRPGSVLTSDERSAISVSFRDAPKQGLGI